MTMSKTKNSTLKFILILTIFSIGFSSCSVQRLVVGMLSDTLAGTGASGNAFMRDNDPELVGDALPFTIKLYELILDMNPDHRPLILTTGSLFIMYANAFVWTPAETLPFEFFDQQLAARTRARNLYLRGRDMLLRGMDLKYKGFKEAALNGQISSYLPRFTKEDVAYLYWIGAGWFGAFTLDTFDLELAVSARTAADLIFRAYELDPDFDNRTLDEFFIAFHAVAPDGLGANRELVNYHFDRVLEVRGDTSVGPYVAMAQNIAVTQQNFRLFDEMITRAKSIDLELDENQMLLNTINRRKALWLRENQEFLFLELE
jgi:predicted anti-sigma-YlaC factor YlaD